jgi:hypothetical protein
MASATRSSAKGVWNLAGTRRSWITNRIVWTIWVIGIVGVRGIIGQAGHGINDRILRSWGTRTTAANARAAGPVAVTGAAGAACCPTTVKMARRANFIICAAHDCHVERCAFRAPCGSISHPDRFSSNTLRACGQNRMACSVRDSALSQAIGMGFRSWSALRTDGLSEIAGAAGLS